MSRFTGPIHYKHEHSIRHNDGIMFALIDIYSHLWVQDGDIH